MDKTIMISNIAKNMRLFRNAKNLSQKNLAEKTGISQAYISKIESMQVNDISIEITCKIADSLGVEWEELFQTPDDDYVEEKYREAILQTYYPPMLSDRLPVSSLLEFITYLPLISSVDLYEGLARVGGTICGHEVYISEKIEAMLRHIPDSPAKKFADILVQYQHLVRDDEHTFEYGSEEFLQYFQVTQEEHIEMYDAYNELIMSRKEQTDLLNDLYENMKKHSEII